MKATPTKLLWTGYQELRPRPSEGEDAVECQTIYQVWGFTSRVINVNYMRELPDIVVQSGCELPKLQISRKQFLALSKKTKHYRYMFNDSVSSYSPIP